MSEQRYWFEEVSEEERYWFLAPWGISPRRKAERESEAEEAGLSPEVADELRSIEDDVRAETAFGISPAEAHKIRMETLRMRERMAAVRYGAAALDVPWWPDVQPRLLEANEVERLDAPTLFTTREQAEEQRRHIEDTEPEAYLELVERYGEETTSEALDNTAPLRALWIDRDALLDTLEDSDFLCVMVDGTLKLRRDFVQELRQKGEEEVGSGRA